MNRAVLLTSAAGFLASLIASGIQAAGKTLGDQPASGRAAAGQELQAAQDKVLPQLPLVLNTWAFTEATAAAWEAMTKPDAAKPALDAVEAGCSRCEALQCDHTVGFGGSPDEAGETTLDAMIMDGSSMEAGAVSDLRFVKQAVTTARLVMEHTQHTMLAGLQATQFAKDMGLPMAVLDTEESAAVHKAWWALQHLPGCLAAWHGWTCRYPYARFNVTAVGGC